MAEAAVEAAEPAPVLEPDPQPVSASAATMAVEATAVVAIRMKFLLVMCMQTAPFVHVPLIHRSREARLSGQCPQAKIRPRSAAFLLLMLLGSLYVLFP